MATALRDRVTYRGRPACRCLATWLPVFERELLDLGLIKKSIDIYQLIGTADASAGTHAGGAADIAQVHPRVVAIARDMGADAAWARLKRHGWDVDHTHLVLTGCPHNAEARYQIVAVRAGYNGRGRAGRGGKDDGPRPLSHRTWTQGVAWAKKRQKDRSYVTKIRAVKAKIKRQRDYLARLRKARKKL